MDTRSLQLFVTLASSLSFSRTAEQLHLSASAVSRTLQRIEAEVGQRLVERDKRSVRLTRAGERFLIWEIHSAKCAAPPSRKSSRSTDVTTTYFKAMASTASASSLGSF